MDIRTPLFRNIAATVAAVLFLNPVISLGANLALDAAVGSNASLGQAGNGVPVVNIATPNGKGLSHNRFSEYNVGQQGLILNNATQATQSTQLGGIILGNQNLSKGAAGLILNEVTGSNPSQLRGYTEVAGQAASVIVANPHGISCDGCGFINTPRVTLSTGKPLIEQGELTRFDVDQGDILIHGEGLNASNVDRFDLITRSARINAELHANELNIVTGRNQVDTDTLQATAKVDNGTDKPLLAIDSSALGGMYAGSIQLIGTEQGVGVRLAGDMAASAGDIQIDASGKLTLGNVSAQQRISAQADGLEATGQVYAGTRLELGSGSDIHNSDALLAGEVIALQANGQLRNQGYIEAGVNSDNSRNSRGDIQLNARQLHNSGDLVARRDLQVDVASTLDNRAGQLTALRQLNVDTGQLDNRGGRIEGRDINLATGTLNNEQGQLIGLDELRVSAGQMQNASGRIASNGSLAIEASGLDQRDGELFSQGSLSMDLDDGDLDNDGGLLHAAGAMVLDNLGGVSNRGGEISSRDSIQLTSTSLDNSGPGRLLADRLSLNVERLLNRDQGLIYGSERLQLHGEQLDNSSGTLASDIQLELMLTGELLNSEGLLSSEGTLLLDIGSLDNQQGSLSSAGDLQLTSRGALNNQAGQLLTDGQLLLRSQSLDNRSGLISAGGDAQLRTGDLDNSAGHLLGNQQLHLQAGQITSQQGRVASAGVLRVDASGLAQQGGELFSQSSLSLDLNGGDLNNDSGLLHAPGDLLLNNLGAVSNRGGEISSNQGFALHAAQLDNSSGLLLSEQDLDVSAAGTLSNQTGTLAGRNIDLAASRMDNSAEGLVQAGGQLQMDIAGTLDNRTGSLTADQALSLSADDIDNRGGQIASKNDLSIQARHITQAAGKLLAEGTLQVAAEQLDNREGMLVANGQVNLALQDIDNRGGEISSRDHIQLTGTSLDNSESGRLLADRLYLNVERLLNRDQGLVYGREHLQLHGGQLDNSTGTLASDTLLELVLTGELINRDGLLSSEGTLLLDSGSLDNQQGSLSSADDLQLTSHGALNNQAGQLLTDGQLLLRSQSLDNRSGLISASGDAQLRTGDLENSAGRLLGNQKLYLQASQITSQQGRIASADALRIEASGLAQQAGELFSQSSLSLDLNGGDLNNDSGLLHAPGTLLLNNLGAVSNRGGEISSNQGFALHAEQLDNTAGRLLSEQTLSLSTAESIENQAGLIQGQQIQLAGHSLDNRSGTLLAAEDLSLHLGAELDNAAAGVIQAGTGLVLHGGEVDNRGGYLLAGQLLDLQLAGTLDNRTAGLVNSQGQLHLHAALLDSSDGGEVSAKGDMQLTLAELIQHQGSLLGSAALSLELQQGRLDNQSGLIASHGPLTLRNLSLLNNQGGEISSHGLLSLQAVELHNDGGVLVSQDWLHLALQRAYNRAGLLSGWQGLTLSSDSLDNRNAGTLSSRSGDLALQLSGALDNSQQGALVAAGDLVLSAGSLDNSGQGVVSSGTDQQLVIRGLLDNRDGQIDAAQALSITAGQLHNGNGLMLAGRSMQIDGGLLDNSGGQISATQQLRLQLAGELHNISGQLISGGPLQLVASALDNRGGSLASQDSAQLTVSSLNNTAQGSVAANGPLMVQVEGTLDNRDGGLLYSRDASLDVIAGQLDNQGGTVQAEDALQLQVAGTLDNRSGQLLSQTGDLQLAAGNLDNRDGIIASLASWLRVQLGGWLRNDTQSGEGGLLQGQQLVLHAAGDVANQSGTITAQVGTARIGSAGFDNRHGLLHAQGQLDLSAEELDNQQGQIAAGDIDFSLGTVLRNQQGILESAGTLAIAAASLDNRGGQLRALGSEGQTLLHIDGLLDNRDGTLETGNQHLTLGMGSLYNQGGSLLHAGTGEFGIALPQLADAGGRIATQGGLTLGADSWHNSSVLQARRLTLNIGTFTQSASGQLLASESLVGQGGDWTNHGLIASDGTLELTLDGRYQGSGQLQSLGNLTLTAAQLELAEQGRIDAAGDANVSLDNSLINQGRITTIGDLQLAAQRLDNHGTLGSAQQVLLSVERLLNEHGLIFSGGDMALHVDYLTNRHADVYSLGNIQLARDAAGNQASRVDNLSGTLEASGDFSLASAVLNNRRNVLEVTNLGKVSAVIDELACRGPYNPGGDCTLGSNGRRVGVWQVTERDELAVTASSTASSLQAGGNLRLSGQQLLNHSSLISAGGDISAQFVTVQNQGIKPGVIETQRIFVSGRKPTYYYYRNAANLFNVVHSPQVQLDTLEEDLSHFIGLMGHEYLEGRQVVEIADGGEDYSAIIQAGGNILVQAGQQLVNSVIRPHYSYVSGGSRVGDTGPGTAMASHITLASQLPPDLVQQQVNPLTLPGFSLPVGHNGLFRINSQGASQAQGQADGHADIQSTVDIALEQTQRTGNSQRVQSTEFLIDSSGAPQVGTSQWQTSQREPTAGLAQPADPDTGKLTASPDVPLLELMPNANAPQHKYLIEANPALTDLKQFLGSDYLLSNMGYDPDQTQKRLGDGLYEQRLVREAIIGRTGQRYLAGLTSDEAIYRHLMDNALASKDALGLALGISLSAEQVAALTHDIVWLEEHELMGERVLVPVLYLAQTDGRLMANGALIQGVDVTLISGGELNNQGTLRASNHLTASAVSIGNNGLLQAGERLQLLATESIRNAQAGILAGRDVSLIAGQDILNERSVTTHQSAAGDRAWASSFAADAARIEAGNSLSLVAGRDVANLGGVLDSRGDLQISAGRDVSISAVQDLQHTSRGSNTLREKVTQLGSQVRAGRDLQVSAGRDLAVIASEVNAGHDLTLQAERNLIVASAANENHLYSKSKKVTHEVSQITQQGAELTAGGDMTLLAGQDLVVVASRLNAGGEAYLVAGEQLALLAAEDLDHSLYEKKKKGSFGRKSFQRDEVTRITQQGTEITTGGDLALISGGDQTYQAANLRSGADLELTSGGAIAFEGVNDLHHESHEKSKSSWAWQSVKGQGHTDETLIQSQLLAQGELVINAVAGLQIDVTEINQHTVSQSIDAMVQADPSLGWIKEMEQRGDVDWRQVKEIHDSFSYSSSGLGGPAAMAIAIAVAYFTAGAASSAIGSIAGAGAGSGSAMAAAGTSAMVTAGTAVGSAGAGWANVALTAAAVSAAGGAAVSTINNRGNLGDVLSDITSRDALKGYLATAITAGATSGILDQRFGASGDSINRVTGGFDLGNAAGLADFGTYLGAQGTLQAVTQTAILGGSLEENLQSALTNQVHHLLQAATFNVVGDLAGGKWTDIDWSDGSPQKIALHAVVGGLLSEATGGDFTTGALTAGANEALIEQLSGVIKDDKTLELAVSQLIGIAAGTITDGDYAKAAELAKNATAYNRQLHPSERELAKHIAEQSDGKYTQEQIEEQLRLAGIRGTDIHAATDILVTANGMYDEGGRWVSVGDEHYVQLFGQADPEVIAFIKSNIGNVYHWTPDAETGFSRYLGQEWNGIVSTGERDRLTGYALDEQGGYRVPMVVDGIAYAPRFHSCGSRECAELGANIDFSDPATIDWIRAADVDTLNKASKVLLAASFVTTGGASAALGSGSTTVYLLAGYMKEDLSGAASTTALSVGFQRFAINSGVPTAVADKMTSALGLAGVWDSVISRARE